MQNFFLLFFFFALLLNPSKELNLLEEKTSFIEDIESNTVTIACLYISKQYIRLSKKETQSSFAQLNLPQDKLYLKLLVLTFKNCKHHLKFEETSEIIDAWLDNTDLELPRYGEIMNPEIRFEDLYDAFDLTNSEKQTLLEIEEIEHLFRRNDERIKNQRENYVKITEYKKTNESFWFLCIFGHSLWKILYVMLFSILVSISFCLLFTGFSLTGKLEALEKDEDSFIEENEGNKNNSGNNKKQGNDKK